MGDNIEAEEMKKNEDHGLPNKISPDVEIDIKDTKHIKNSNEEHENNDTRKTDDVVTKVVDEIKQQEDVEVKNDPKEKEESVRTKTGSEEFKNDNGQTISSSHTLKSSNPSISTAHENFAATPVPTSMKIDKEKHIARNQSEILSPRQEAREEDPSMMIFSHKGLPTKKYYKRREMSSTVLPFGHNDKDLSPTRERSLRKYRSKQAELTPKISQVIPNMAKKPDIVEKGLPFSDRNPNEISSQNPSVSRNVLTGRGVNSQDEFKSKSMRRKDGNPVLGTGYDEPAVPNNTGRVPPGGFSSGLW